MNRYYEDPYDEVKSCGMGNHGKRGYHRNGCCIDCGRSEADRTFEKKRAEDSIPSVKGKHKKVNT